MSHLQNFYEFFADFHWRQQLLQIFAKFQRIFSGISQNFHNFAMSDAQIAIFKRNLRKIAEITQVTFFSFLFCQTAARGAQADAQGARVAFQQCPKKKR